MIGRSTVVCTLVISSAVAGVATDVRTGDFIALAIAAGSLVAVSTDRKLRRILGCLILGSGMCAWSASGRDRAVAPPLLEWFDGVAGAAERGPGPVALEGRLLTDAVPAPEGIRLLIDVERVQDGSGWHSVAGRVQALVSGALAPGRSREWTAGRRVRAPISLRRPVTQLNFGGSSPRWSALRRPFALVGTIKSALVVQTEPGSWWNEIPARVRWRVRDTASKFVGAYSRDGGAIAAAILIGDRAGLTDRVERRLQDAGTYHVIAISGGNVALLTGLCFVGLRMLIRPHRAVIAVTLASIVAYGAIVGGEPSVARAVTAAGIYLAFGLVGLRPEPVAALRAVAILLVVVDPLVVLDTGAWLSFAATLGILVFVRKWQRVWNMPAGRFAWLRLAARWGLLLTAATAAAEILLAPISASVFSRVSLAGFLLNPVAIPAMALVQLAGLLTIFAASVSTAAANAAAAVAAWGAAALLHSSALVDYWPWLSWRVPPVSLTWLFLYYGALAYALAAASTRWRRIGVGVASGAMSVILFAPETSLTAPREGRLRVSVIDVGQGDAILLQTPDGHALLIDTGGTPGEFDVGGRLVTPAVWALGVRRLDWLALSHGDRDHAGGAVSVVRDLLPREIWEAVPVPRDPARHQLQTLSRRNHIAWRTLQTGGRLDLGAVTIEAMHPPAPEWERQKVRNDDSLVLRVLYREVEVWLTGDAGVEFESRLLANAATGRVRILKVGHHGSRSSTSQRLLSAIRPQIAVISAGAGNLFGHPSREVLARLAESGVEVFRTDRDGAVVIETDGVVARARSASGRSWMVATLGS